MYAEGSSLTHQQLVEALCQVLGKRDVDPSKCCGCFWIGAAMTATEKGMQDSVIKTLGRWKSLVLFRIHDSKEIVTPGCYFHKTLVNHNTTVATIITDHCILSKKYVVR